mgnify:CR=1 FL=1
MTSTNNCCVRVVIFFFFQAEDGIRDLVRSRGLGDVYKRQRLHHPQVTVEDPVNGRQGGGRIVVEALGVAQAQRCLLYTSDAADERSSVDLGGRRIIKKKNVTRCSGNTHTYNNYTNHTIYKTHRQI